MRLHSGRLDSDCCTWQSMMPIPEQDEDVLMELEMGLEASSLVKDHISFQPEINKPLPESIQPLHLYLRTPKTLSTRPLNSKPLDP